MVSVGNYMWISTSEQKLFIVHTPSMKTVVSVSLKNGDNSVINLLHVMEWHAVLVRWTGSEIWYLQDSVGHAEIVVLDKQKLDSPLLHWCEVVFQGRVEVWGTQDNGKVVILDWPSMGQHTNVLSMPTVNCNYQHTFEHIACTVMESSGSLDDLAQRVWVSFKHTFRLMCWDAITRTPLFCVKIPTKSKILSIYHTQTVQCKFYNT